MSSFYNKENKGRYDSGLCTNYNQTLWVAITLQYACI